MNKVNIAIVGGGITALSTAYYLAKNGGEDIHIFEAKYLGYGSTGRCAGGIRASFTSEVHVALMRESINEWKKWSKDIEGISFRQDGYLWILTDEEQVRIHKELMKLHNSLGVNTRMVYEEELKEIVPAMQLNDVIGALYDPTAGKAIPLHAVWALRRKLRSLGVKIHEYTPVNKVHVGGGRAKSLDVEGVGTVEVGDALLVAAGYETKHLLKNVGYDLPIKGDPHHLMITEKAESFLKPLVIHKASGSYIVQVASGGLIVGTEYPVPENDMSLRIGFIRKGFSIISKYFPQVLKANLLRVWIGYYLKTPDHHPLIGLVPSYDNLLLATGYSGHGYMMAPIVGKELASLIMEGRPTLKYTEELHPGRYEEGKYLEEKAIFG